MTASTQRSPGSGEDRANTRPRFGILGPLQAVADDGRRVDIGGPKQRDLLAMLLVQLNQFVPASRLIDELWDGAPPASADVTLRTHVSRLRQRLAAVGSEKALVTRPSGYGLVLDPELVDSYRFERLAALGQEALGLGKPERAAQLLRAALELWRGEVLEDLGSPGYAQSEATRLDELRLVTLESRMDADLQLGRHSSVVAELDQFVAAHPFRERPCGQLMLALYRCGRQVDALATFSSVRQRLADELGLDPGPALVDLETAILRHDPSLLLPDEWSRQPPTDSPAVVRPPSKPPDALFAAARRTPMVARSAELQRLRALWEAVRDGGRHVVLISGEAGVGKTRLVAEVAQLANNEAAVLVGRCDPVAAMPYHVVVEALRGSAEVASILAEAPEVVRVRLAPLLDDTDARSDAAASPTDEVSDARRELFEACEWLLTRVSARVPVLFVVEEAERLDRAGSLLLRHLAGRLPQHVLLVVSFRDPPGSRHGPLLELLNDLERRSMADRLVLRSLTERDVGELVANMTGDDVRAPLVRQVWRATGGNPFYATEVVRDLAAREGVDGDRPWQVPSGVRDVLRHRLQALPQLTQQVVCAAAVLGHEVEFTLLPELVDQPEGLVVDAVELAVQAGFLVESGSSWKGSYAFAHELTRDAVYADIPAPRRQRLHRRAAQALLSENAVGGAVVAAAAVHMRAAGPAADPIRAAELSLQAAADAGRIYAWDEAVMHAEAAVEILDHVGAPARLRADAAVRAALLRLKSSIGYPRAVEHLEAALEHYRAIGDDAALGSVHSRLGGALCLHHSVMDIPRAIEHFAAAERLLAAPRAAFHLHRGQAQAAMFGLRTDLLGTASERAQELAAELGRPDLGVVAGWGRAWFAFNRGRLAAASDIRETMWATAHQLGDPYLGWVSVGAASLCATEYLLDPGSGRAWCRRGLAQARFETFAHPHETVVDQLALSLATVGELHSARVAADGLPDDAVAKRWLLLLDGDWEAAEQSLAAAVDRDEQAGDLQDATLNGRWLAQARLLLGRADDATAALDRALAWAIDGPQVPSELLIRAELARALAAQGDRAGAAGHLARCDEIVGVGEDWRGVVGVVELARGAVASVRGHRRRSDVAYARALEVFGAYQLPWRRAEALHAWAQSLVAAGHADEAVERHRAASTAYEELGATPRWRRPLAAA